MPKIGRFNKEEKEFIKNNCHLFSSYVIAQKLDRTVKSVRIEAERMGAIFKDGEQAPAQEEIKSNMQLSNCPEWELIRREFQPEELDYFKKKFASLIQQFREDLLRSTELTQIFQLIKFEILMTRNLQSCEENKEEIERIRKRIDEIHEFNDGSERMPKDDMNMIISYENQIASLRGSQESKSKEYMELNKSHVALMRELKATRDQRIDKIENSKKTFVDVIKELQDEEYNYKEGRQNELVKMAVKNEKDRLSEFHTYQNSELDKPILNSDTVGEEDDE